MGRALVIIASDADRSKLHAWIAKAPWNTRVTFQGPKRSVPQNDLMWSRLTEISENVVWYGQKLTTDDWKDIFTASLRKARVVPGLDGGSFVPLGMRTSDMSKEEMTALLDLIDAFAAEHDVTFHEAAA
jgi:hypothetical protein